MASSKRSWKLQEYKAHEANVNSLALGHKSGRVLVTGGDDKKVNLWAVGKQNCIMSLSGHATPIESVRFNSSEELVCAGSQTGAIKIWDLEAAKLVRTLTGHKGGIKCSDFHPYGDFLASGSHDTAIKLWDTRRRGCIFTYKGHTYTVNSLKFSPDGQWIASGGDEGHVKVWDIRMGRVLKEFTDHTSSISSVEFHPHEFLLASGSLDRTVNFWDLENFQLVSTERDASAVRCLTFNPGGECLYTGSSDSLRVLGWEPSRILDILSVGWGRVHDIAIAQNQLIGASFHLTDVMLYVVEIRKLQPFGGPTLNDTKVASPFARESVRRSFSRERGVELSPKTVPQVKTIEESTSGTDQEEEPMADIPNVKDYQEIFKPNRSLIRTPPPQEPFEEPADDIDPTKPQILFAPSRSDNEYLSLSSLDIQSGTPSLQHQSNSLELHPTTGLNLESGASHLTTSSSFCNRSLSNLESVFRERQKLSDAIDIRKSKPIENITDSPESEPIRPPRLKSPTSIPNSPQQKHLVRRQNSCKDVPQSNDNGFHLASPGLKHSVSELNINRSLQSRSNSFNRGLNNAPTSRKEIQSKLTNNRNSNYNSSRIPNPTSTYSGRPLDKPVTVRSGQPTPVDIYVIPRNISNRSVNNAVKNLKNSLPDSEELETDFIPMSVDKPVGLDLDDFIPKSSRNFNNKQTMSNMSEAEVLGNIMRGHEPMMTVLTSRMRSLQLVYSIWHNKGVKSAVEGAIAKNDLTILVDVLGVMVLKTSLWSLDICVLMLPKIQDLLQSKYETYMQTGCNALRLILQNFLSVIKNNVQTPCGSFGVDITKEERYRKCKSCHDMLLSIRAFLLKRQTMQGTLGTAFRELHKQMQSLD